MKKINEWFICISCKKQILPAQKTCRDHCPYCFTWLHVDWGIPWDRSALCWEKMFPIEYVISNWALKILFKCIKCGKQHWNKSALDDEIINLDKLIYEYKRFF